MRCNMNRLERNLRLIAGTLMTSWLLAGGPLWTILGLFLLFTGAWRFCPIYALFSRRRKRVK